MTVERAAAAMGTIATVVQLTGDFDDESVALSNNWADHWTVSFITRNSLLAAVALAVTVAIVCFWMHSWLAGTGCMVVAGACLLSEVGFSLHAWQLTELRNANQQLKQNNEQYQSLNEENQRLLGEQKQLYAASCQQLEHLKTQVRQLQSSNQEYTRLNEQHGELHQQSQQQVEQLKRSVQELEQERRALQESLTEVTEHLGAHMRRLAEHTGEHKNLLDTATQLQAQHSTDWQQRQSELKAVLASFQEIDPAKLRHLQEEIIKATQVCSETQQRLAQTEQQLTQVSTELSKRQSELEQTTRKIQAETAHLTAARERLVILLTPTSSPDKMARRSEKDGD